VPEKALQAMRYRARLSFRVVIRTFARAVGIALGMVGSQILNAQ
jgi:hypothetical protein